MLRGLQNVGVCPDSTQARNASANNVKLLGYSEVNGVVRAAPPPVR